MGGPRANGTNMGCPFGGIRGRKLCGLGYTVPLYTKTCYDKVSHALRRVMTRFRKKKGLSWLKPRKPR
ncbi:hypothetical protein BLEM_1877 [Bifidobacterium lemurum]|uniref:Uncharacterized protein n=1 Tax=Bifidobacterium lemurum TaxID=1603886 RepID=A0A261FM55_9BIFI|nr:hypothetical protein BLEM_1877 [Bifidobacterium lemurum]